jgi:uncharacterized damage-inducible protein DinB
MPADEIRKIREKIEKARAQLLSAVEDLDAATWEWQPCDGRWSIRLTMAHVASAQWSHLAFAQRAATGEETRIPGFDLDAWNAAHVAERADWPIERILGDLQSAQERTLAFLDGIDTASLDRAGSHPALGQVTVGQALRVIAVHEGMHRRDIVKLLDEMRRG